MFVIPNVFTIGQCIRVGRTGVTLITSRYLRLIWLGDNDRTLDDNVEMVLCTLGFKVLSMRSAHSAAVRDECVEAFTSTGNIEDVQMLCTSTRIASTAVHRMGQKYPCPLLIFTVDGSYDQSAQANQALKMRPIIAGQAGIADPTPEQCDQFRHMHPEVAGIKELGEEIIASIVVSDASSRLYTNIFGQRTNTATTYRIQGDTVVDTDL
ncbi:hypothetical protein XANCAGTX0491_008790 [Xanthoria calcicola]